MEQYQGKITKGVGGNYEVHVEGTGVVLCRAKGILRYRRMQPLIGDNVTITVDDTGAGNIAEILPRENELVRPAIANVDQALLIVRIADPRQLRLQCLLPCRVVFLLPGLPLQLPPLSPQPKPPRPTLPLLSPPHSRPPQNSRQPLPKPLRPKPSLQKPPRPQNLPPPSLPPLLLKKRTKN